MSRAPLIDADMQAWTRCALPCGKRTKSGKRCKRYIVGTFDGYMYFEAQDRNKFPRPFDMRNQEYRCYQHEDVEEFGEE